MPLSDYLCKAIKNKDKDAVTKKLAMIQALLLDEKDEVATTDTVNGKTKNDETALILAAKMGFIEIIPNLFAAGATIDTQDSFKRSALHYAAAEGHLEICKILLTNKANVNQIDSGKSTPLLTAAKHKNSQLVTYFLTDAKPDLATKDIDGFTVLHFAAQHGDLENLKTIFETAPSLIHQLTALGESPLHLAVKYGHLKTVEYILANTPSTSFQEVDPHHEIALMWVAASKHISEEKAPSAVSKRIQLARMLLAHQINPNQDPYNKSWSYNLLNEIFGYYNCYELMDNSSAKPWLHTALLAAVYNGQTEIVLDLIEHKANVETVIKNETNLTMLQLATRQGHVSLVTALLKRKPIVHQENEFISYMLLHYAVASDKAAMVELILTHLLPLPTDRLSFFINKKDRNGNTPLHIAARAGHTEIISLLLAKNAAINIFNDASHSPTYDAALSPKSSAAAMRILLNADPVLEYEVVKKDGTKYMVSALIASAKAVSDKNSAVTQLLINAKASVHTKDDSQHTALFHAVNQGNIETMKILLQAGSSLTPDILRNAVIGNLETFKELVVHHSNYIDAKKTLGEALCHAIAKNQSSIVNVLLEVTTQEDFLSYNQYLYEEQKTETGFYYASRYDHESSLGYNVYNHGNSTYQYNTTVTSIHSPLSLAKHLKQTELVKYFEVKIAQKQKALKETREQQRFDETVKKHKSQNLLVEAKAIEMRPPKSFHKILLDCWEVSKQNSALKKLYLLTIDFLLKARVSGQNNESETEQQQKWDRAFQQLRLCSKHKDFAEIFSNSLFLNPKDENGLEQKDGKVTLAIELSASVKFRLKNDIEAFCKDLSQHPELIAGLKEAKIKFEEQVIKVNAPSVSTLILAAANSPVHNTVAGNNDLLNKTIEVISNLKLTAV